MLLGERNQGQKFLDYGDDLVIADPNVASEYLKIMDECEVTISKEKSLISSVGACEFAKRFMTEKVTVDFSPISFKVMNMFGGFVPHYQLDGLHYRTSVRLRGGGSRVYSTGDKPPKGSRRWLRHWLLMYSEKGGVSIPFDIWVTFPEGGS